MAASDIILGDGVFTIGATTTASAIALTRGGGSFTVERDYREIEADGDYGPVKDRIRLVRSVPKLNIKSLEWLADQFEVYHPSLSASLTAAITGGVTATVTGRGLTTNITTQDYNTVTWTGYTREHTSVFIQLDNAINLDNIDFSMVDKEEVLHEMTFTAAYASSTRNTEPWKIIYTSTS